MHLLKPIKLKLKSWISSIIIEMPEFKSISNSYNNSCSGNNSKLYAPFKFNNSSIGSYSYIARNSIVNNTKIGKFCSIGANFVSGWGIHPIHSLSSSPMFYSLQKQNGITLSSTDKIQEVKDIVIGNDVFIGMNVTVLDGVSIGDGAVIGAGAVVSKSIPPYAVAVGNPIKIIKYRFSEDDIANLLSIKWWDWEEEQLKEVEKFFNNINDFIEKYK